MMNLSFSTRGWHDTPWEVLVEEAHENGFSGIELYNPLKYEAFTGKDGPFHRYKIASTVRDLARRGIRIPCFDSPIDLSGDREESELQEHIQCAHRAGVVVTRQVVASKELCHFVCALRGKIAAPDVYCFTKTSPMPEI